MARIAKELGPLAVSRLTKQGLHAVGGVSGLYLQVLPARVENGQPILGARSWVLRATVGGKRRDMGLGGFPSVTLAYPHIGKMAVRDIEVAHVLKVLEPVWHDRTETASRLRGRLELVLDWATARGYRDGLNPARWRGHLDKMLPNPSKLKPGGHMAALPVSELGGFMGKLRAVGGQGAKALEFLILTAARSGEVRGATWSEINLNEKTWTVPAARMKMGREHRVPLSPAAVTLLETLPRMAGTDLVFPSARGGQLSDRTLIAALRRMGTDVTAHGFRSTFRDWCGEYTNFPREVAEAALAHSIGDATERAYRRSDALEKRRKLMEAWAGFCAAPAGASGTVTPIRGAVA